MHTQMSRCARHSTASPPWRINALIVAGVTEIFNYRLQPGRVDVGALSATQVDRSANVVSTVIGSCTCLRPVCLAVEVLRKSPRVPANNRYRQAKPTNDCRRGRFRHDGWSATHSSTPPRRSPHEGLAPYVVTDLDIYQPRRRTNEMILSTSKPIAPSTKRGNYRLEYVCNSGYRSPWWAERPGTCGSPGAS